MVQKLFGGQTKSGEIPPAERPALQASLYQDVQTLVNSGQLSSAGSQKESGKMHHTRGVKRPAGMGGPHCDHSPSSLICSHYPYQHLKIKNKDRESDGGRREAAAEREWGK